LKMFQHFLKKFQHFFHLFLQLQRDPSPSPSAAARRAMESTGCSSARGVAGPADCSGAHGASSPAPGGARGTRTGDRGEGRGRSSRPTHMVVQRGGGAGSRGGRGRGSETRVSKIRWL
jgi:hypothetical protein